MPKPKDIESYAPEWESLGRTMTIGDHIIPIGSGFTRREAIDIRSTYYAYVRALSRSASNPLVSDARRQEYSILWRAMKAYQFHADPNPNHKSNEGADFTLKFVKQSATAPMRKFFDALEDKLAPKSEFPPGWTEEDEKNEREYQEANPEDESYIEKVFETYNNPKTE